ncbi:MAG: hypothetical protein ACE5NG_03615 [bacterium]
MVEILKKSDWGNYWSWDFNIDNRKLKARTFAMLSKLEVSVPTLDMEIEINKLSREIYEAFHHDW